MARLRVLGGRRLTALAVLLCAWALLIALCAPWPRARARALRAGALGVLWAPVAVLAPAALHPGALVEYLTIALLCLALGAITDALLPWPRAAIAPALFALVALTADALAHTQLLMRSLLGPNPILGARFYGIGNEVKSGLAVLVLAAVAGLLYPSVHGRRGALAMIVAGVVLAAIEGSARIGAGVGGVILVSAAFAVAAATLAGGTLTRRRTAVVVLSPLAALAALAVLDLLTAHGTGHYSGSILHAHSAGELRDVLVRRYSAAWGELHNHAMPAATAAALACAAVAVRRRERLLAPVGYDPGWLAVFERRSHRGHRRRAQRGLGPGAAGRRRVRARLRGHVSVGGAGSARARRAIRRRGGGAGGLSAPQPAQSRQAPWITISCSDTASGTRSERLVIARSSAGSENGITTPHSSQTRW